MGLFNRKKLIGFRHPVYTKTVKYLFRWLWISWLSERTSGYERCLINKKKNSRLFINTSYLIHLVIRSCIPYAIVTFTYKIVLRYLFVTPSLFTTVCPTFLLVFGVVCSRLDQDLPCPHLHWGSPISSQVGRVRWSGRSRGTRPGKGILRVKGRTGRGTRGRPNSWGRGPSGRDWLERLLPGERTRECGEIKKLWQTCVPGTERTSGRIRTWPYHGPCIIHETF